MDEGTEVQVELVDTYIRSFKRTGEVYVVEFEHPDLQPVQMTAAGTLIGNVVRLKRWTRGHKLVSVGMHEGQMVYINNAEDKSALCEVLDAADLLITHLRHDSSVLRRSLRVALVTRPTIKLRARVINRYLG